jgi:hypothetical protein
VGARETLFEGSFVVELVQSVCHSGYFDIACQDLKSYLRLRKTGIKYKYTLDLFLVDACL